MVSQKVFLFLGSDKCYSCILDTFYAIFHVIDYVMKGYAPAPALEQFITVGPMPFMHTGTISSSTCPPTLHDIIS
jgi:hypothetical protein